MTRNTEVRFQINLEDDADEEGDTSSAKSPLTGTPASPKPRRQRRKVEFVGMEDLERNDKRSEVENDLKRVHGKHARSARYAQPRMSLLGKPLNYRAHKRDARYRRLQVRIYNFLERPKDWRAISYHLLV